jgi:hypothetical protein
MSGNVSEIDDSCSGDAGQSDLCRMHGGSYLDSLYASRCSDAPLRGRGDQGPGTGFRCCKDP